jgi:hypothetical protein
MALIPRSRRGWIILVVLTLSFFVGAWWVNRQLEPHRLTAIVLGQLGSSYKVDLSFDGDPDYAMRPEPRLLIPNLVASDPVSGKVILRTERLDVSLPWATITGGYPVITRLQLQKPQLDLPAMQSWLATLPEAPFRLPTLNKGLTINGGQVNGDGWQLNAVELSLPRLKQDEAAKAELALKFVQGKTAASFSGIIEAATAGLVSDLKIEGKGELEHSPKPLAYTLSLDGHYLNDDAGWHVDAKSLRVQGDSPLPTFALNGKASLGESLQLDFRGELAQWPKDWPALPAPLNEAKGPLPVHVAYQGKPDLSDTLTLDLAVNETKFNSNLQLPQLQAWLADDKASPLPPLNGTLTAPALTVEGIELKGVSIEISDDSATATPPVGP